MLNEHFAGTYDAFFVLSHEDPESWRAFSEEALALLEGLDGAAEVRALLSDRPENQDAALGEIIPWADDALFEATDPNAVERLEDLLALAERTQSQGRYFQRPDALEYIESFQQALEDTGLVGKSNALPDVVKVVNRELRSGEPQDYEIPGSVPGVAQALLQFQSSHRPQDLWHMVTPNYRHTAIWLQLRSGDNQDMNRVIDAVDAWLAGNPLPNGVEGRWAGKTYINVVWQGEMVSGMLRSLVGSFIVVFAMMALLFRSVRWGAIAMLPLSVTILGVYGFIGWIGKSYDMPIAVLSALTLGLSIDFAIHFIQRMRELVRELGDVESAMRAVFQEPARAIARNAIVIALGFTPLFLASLIPYVTVGAFMASIMMLSGAATLLLLPAAMTLWRHGLFPQAVDATNQGDTQHAN